MEEKTEMEQGPKTVPKSPEGAFVEFNNVTFGYNQDKNILNQLSFNIGPGKWLFLRT